MNKRKNTPPGFETEHEPRFQPKPDEVSPRAREAADAEIDSYADWTGQRITIDLRGTFVQRALDAARSQAVDDLSAATVPEIGAALDVKDAELARLTQELAESKERQRQLQHYIDTDAVCNEFSEMKRHRDHLVTQGAELLGDVDNLRIQVNRLKKDLAETERERAHAHGISDDTHAYIERVANVIGHRKIGVEGLYEMVVTLKVERDTLAQRVAELETELQSVRVCFAEASQSAGPTTVHVETPKARCEKLEQALNQSPE